MPRDRWTLRGRRVPLVQQMSATECGAACLAMIAGFFGRHLRVAELRDVVGVGRDGASAVDIVRAAESFGLRARALSVDLASLREMAFPAIVFWQFNHYVVLERWDGRRAVVADPAAGRRVIPADEFSRGFTGIALTFRPGREFRTRAAQRGGGVALFVRALRALPARLIGAVLAASLALQVLVLAPALVTKVIVDTVVRGTPDALTIIGIGAVLLVVTNVVATYARGLLLNQLHTALDKNMMSRFFDHLLSLPYRYFQLRGSGDLLLRLSSHTAIRDAISGQTLSLVIDGLFIGGYVVFLLLVAPAFAGLAALLGGLQCVVVALTFRAMRSITRRDVGAQAEAQSRAVEILSGAETIKAMGAESHAYSSWSRLFDRQLAASLDRRRLDAFLDASLTGFRVVAPVIILLFGAREVLAGRLSVGSMLAMSSLVSGLLGPLAGLVGGTRQLQTVGTHLDRIRDVLDEPPEQPPGRAIPATGSGEVTVTGAGFRYGGNSPWALRDITLHVPSGAKVALVGATGSGKSSLARMLLGLYPPDEGEVHHDGRPLHELDHRALRQRCGVVTQEPAMFAGSIRENIAFGRDGVTVEAVERSARYAQIHDEIAAMPMGYETVLDEKGAGLSGGQRQRLALARALVHEPSLVVLDEATSHLDVVTERRVGETLSALRCTRIVIAHRLSTVVDADLIVVLERGRVVETGTHAELLARHGSYRTLVEDQLRTGDLPTPS